MKQLPLPISPPAQPTLHNFVVGDNAAVVAHLRTLLASISNTSSAHALAAPTPLYLWGPPGCGKTHLLRAGVAACHGAGARVGWFGALDPLPWLLDPTWSLVVVDGCDALSPAAQHAAFVLFTEAATHGVPFAAAGTLPPADLPLREDLRTRLAWGHVFAVQPLHEEGTRVALSAEAQRRGFFLTDEVTTYLLHRFPRDLRTLMGLLAHLDEHGLATGRRLTVPLVREFVAGLTDGGCETPATAPTNDTADPVTSGA